MAPLPRPLTGFVGREPELAELGRGLRDPEKRLLTLIGPGGVGKTRLALMAAERAAAEFDDIVFVDLTPLDEPSLALPTIAEALGVRDADHPVLFDRIGHAVGERRLLLVLDNLERVTVVGPELSTLLHCNPALVLLGTSRIPLRVSGEHEFPVAPLDETAAVRLFVERARAVRPEFTLTPQNESVLAELCLGLDRLPLAIELAAVRTKVLSPEALLNRLEHRLALLTGGPRDHPARLRSMRDAVSWSYELLTEAEQTLLRRLAVFIGGFTLASAEAVAGGDAFEGISALVDKSLVTRNDSSEIEQRFGMLETVREFALEQLDQLGERRETSNRFAACLLDLAIQFDGNPLAQEAEPHFERLAAEINNLRAALEWLLKANAAAGMQLAGSLVWFWYARSHRAEGHRLLERLAPLAEHAEERVRADLLLGLGILSHGAGSSVRAVPPLRECLALRRCLNDAMGTAIALTMLGIQLENLGAYYEATPLFEEAESIFDTLAFPVWSAVAHHHRGVLAHGQGDLARAETLLTDAVERHRQLDAAGVRTVWLASAINDLGVVIGQKGNLARAAALHVESLTGWLRTGTFEGAADALANLGVVNAPMQPARAARLFGAASRLAETLGYDFELPERSIHDRAIALLQDSLGTAFNLEWNVGRALPFEVATTEAMAFTDLEPTAATRKPRTAGGLSQREHEVLALVAAGQTDRQIAATLFISPRTVQVHVASILTKLNVPTRTAAAAAAVRDGFV